MQEQLRKALQEMLDLQRTRAGEQDFDKVLNYTRKRLDQNSMNESRLRANESNMSSIDFNKKPNFLAD